MLIESLSRYRSKECTILAGHVVTKYMPIYPRDIPVGTRRQNDVASTSMRRSHVASPMRRHPDAVCPLGLFVQMVISIGKEAFNIHAQNT